MSDLPRDLDPKAQAAIAMLGRTGAQSFQIRFIEDPLPVVWVALVTYAQGWDSASGRSPEEAILRLAERVVDGGVCVHCLKPTGFDPDMDEMDEVLPGVCWYTWDPELKVIRRGCEGDQ